MFSYLFFPSPPFIACHEIQYYIVHTGQLKLFDVYLVSFFHCKLAPAHFLLFKKSVHGVMPNQPATMEHPISVTLRKIQE